MLARLRTRLRAEGGIVVPLTVVVMTLVVLLAGVAATDAGLSGYASREDRDVKRALQVADAGLNATLYRYNLLAVGRSSSPKCVTYSSSGTLQTVALAAGQTYCPAMEEEVADGGRYSVRVSAETQPIASDSSLVHRTIVSTGRAGGQTRRVAATLATRTALPLFGGGFAVFSELGLLLDSNSNITGDAGSNGNIDLKSNSFVCGNATPGPTGSVFQNTGTVRCGGSTAKATQTRTLSPVTRDTSVNDNARICAVGGDACTSRSEIFWDPTRRRLKLDGGSTLTLGGDTYSFCYLEINSNAQLIIPARTDSAPVTIYMESPENCSGTTTGVGTTEQGNILVSGNARFTNQNTNPALLRVFMKGSTATPKKTTSLRMLSNVTSVSNMSIYAPESEVYLDSNVAIAGAFAAERVEMKGSSKITYDSRVQSIQSDGVFPLLRQEAFRECSRAAPAGGSPDAGC